jgi:hypothetical protein
MQVTIVVPTIREQNLYQFLKAWEPQFASYKCNIIIIEDNPERTFEIPRCDLKIEHYSWKEIDKELGKKSWIIPRRTDCIRSFGYYKSWQQQPDIIITLDDDCFPVDEDFIGKHFRKLSEPGVSNAWISTGESVKPRGMPYENLSRVQECVINHGLWTNVPDWDAITQLANKRNPQEFKPVEQVIPRGMYFPMCGMNLAFKPLVVPAMYFLLMGRDWPYDRFGDIWAGIFVKKICDHLGYCIKSGEPFVEHKRASNVWANLKKEMPGYEVNEILWAEVDRIVLRGLNFGEAYKELAEKIPMKGEYWDKLKEAMVLWAELYDN